MPNRSLIATDEEDLLAMEVQVGATLEQTKHLAGNALSQGNPSYFLTRADHWFLLASLRWRLHRDVEPLSQALENFLHESLSAMELGATRPAAFAHSLWSVALTLGDIRTAHFIAAMPEAARGLPPPPQAHRIVAESRVGFAVLRGDRNFARQVLEVFQGLCFDTDPSELVTHELLRARQVYPVLVAVTEGDSRKFETSLGDLLRAFHPGRLCSEFNERIAALGLMRLAQLQGLEAVTMTPPPDLPVALLHTVTS